tara:strand:+ start:285 stop:1151 length:867 start_codon:yes stop_codon:yes gene_type:complete
MPKKGLGKGLKALIPEYDSVNENNHGNEILISSIIPNKNQPRSDFSSKNAKKALEDLSNSIRENGVLQPVTVRQIKNNNYELVAGERRLRASKIAGLKTIPCYIIQVDNESEMLEFALIENIQREGLNPIEEAESYLLLIEKYKLSQSQIAKKVGKGRTTITNSLRLLKLPENIKESLISGQIQAGHARTILKLSNSKDINNIFDKLIEKNLSVRQLEELTTVLIKNKKNINNKIKTEALNINFDEYEKKISQIFKNKVKIKNSNGKLIISFSKNSNHKEILSKLINS